MPEETDKHKRGLINYGRVLINPVRAARVINTRHATRHPNAIFDLFTLLCSFLDSFLALINAEKTKKR